MKISCVVHTRNSEATLERALASVTWADELIVVDMQSTDQTLEIAGCFTDRIFTTPAVPRVDGIRNEFIAKAAHEWVFVLDSDEYLAEDAGPEIRALVQRHSRTHDAIAFPRFNYIAGQVLRGSGWYPDHQIRLFRKGTLRWSDTTHRLPEVLTGVHRLLELAPPDCIHLHHQNYRDLREFIRRQVEYALNDSYNPDAGKYDFESYLAEARRRLEQRRDCEEDGDLSQALSLLLAWDSVVRGVIHWDELQRAPQLSKTTALPAAAPLRPGWRIRAQKWLVRHHSLRFFLRSIRNKARGLLFRRTSP